jgi:hypothetical protein
MQRRQPPRDPPPHEVGEAGERVLADRMPEVVGPTADDLAEPDQYRFRVLVAARIFAFNDRTGRSATNV